MGRESVQTRPSREQRVEGAHVKDCVDDSLVTIELSGHVALIHIQDLGPGHSTTSAHGHILQLPTQNVKLTPTVRSWPQE